MKPVQVWEECWSVDSKRCIHVYAQPLWAYLLGRMAYWIWMHCPKWVTNHHGERWLLAFELLMTHELFYARAENAEFLQVSTRYE